jgi:pilus assembly protein CpaE
MTAGTIVVDGDPVTAQRLANACEAGVEFVATMPALRQRLDVEPLPLTVVLGPSVPLHDAFDVAEQLRLRPPAVGVVLVRETIDTRLLAEAIRTGVREVVPAADQSALSDAVKSSDALSRKIREVSTPEGHADKSVGARVVTVFSAKGGSGKTTMATNLAAALADRGRRDVVLVDLDLAFGDVAIALQLFPAHTIANAVPLGEDDLDFQALQILLTPHSPGLTTLVAPLEPSAAETVPASLVSRIVEVLKDNFDFVVIDTPPAFDDQVLAAFDASDVLVLIATLDIPALKNLKLTLETLELLNYPRDRWRVVLNRADSKVGLAVAEVERTLRVGITAKVPSSRDVPASINRGAPLVLENPRHPVSVAIRDFAEDHVAPIRPAEAGAQPSGGPGPAPRKRPKPPKRGRR